MIRKIKRIVNGRYQQDGAGVKLQRVIANRDIYDFDPFLMLDTFDSKDSDDYIKGFPWHPHRGIETVTYLIHGKIEHSDSLGNKGEITDRYCQWMTAGSGILHQEMPKPSPHMYGFQLWINLPAGDKMTHPKYNDLDETKISVFQTNDCVVRLISGNYQGNTAVMQGDYVKADIMDVSLMPGYEWTLEVNDESTVFIYIFEGEATFFDTDTPISDHQAVLFEKGDLFKIKAGKDKLRFTLFSGMALKEPIAWGGPIVMNTKEELDQAFNELKNNTFIKHQ
ncbi:MAG: pirin family protein [Candidatus Cloacimonetes bacterium]|nr:pirin family protein [Candidatus Cloacimonadota bacterium]MDD4155104.1 pirin family protein [Candidatus Cloacimonadota bacterium]